METTFQYINGIFVNNRVGTRHGVSLHTSNCIHV